ncbi:MAG TPA: helix-turn-helix domain-containing protein [Candidatus Koribacter sp.]|jgi:DNA-binding transcriptional ArsR family regulator
MSSSGRENLVFKALADPRRRAMLDFLKEDRRTTGEVCDRFPKIDRCTVMLHLRVLEKAGLIAVKREGRVRWNYLDIAPLQRIYERWISRYAAPSAALLLRMKKGIEES